MKKIFLISLTFFVSMITQAQTEHLKFMGIPLDGKIGYFHTQLLKKGCTINELYSKVGKSNGTRIYDGSFSGNQATIIVFYNEKTKIVYRAKAVIELYTEEQVKDKYFSIKEMLLEKYDPIKMLKQKHEDALLDSFPKWYFEVQEEKYESSTICVIDINEFERLGLIDLYIRENESSITYKTEYSLHIDYTDKINSELDKKERMDDL